MRKLEEILVNEMKGLDHGDNWLKGSDLGRCNLKVNLTVMGKEESMMTQVHFLLEHLQNVLTERMC